MAASTPAGAPQVGSASWVSEHFVRLFYSVLARHPGHLSKFYKEHSSLCVSLSSAAGSPPAFAHGDLQAVQNIVNTTIAFAQCTPDFTNSVFSIDGGVVIQCVGRITGLQGQSRERPYVQTFFLARQEHGYYVLNDILRLLPEVQPYTPSPVASNLPPTVAHPATQEEVVSHSLNQKVLQDMQANQPRPPTMNGPPSAPQAPPAAPAPAPPSKPSPAPAPQQPQSTPSTQPKATQPKAPAPAPTAPTTSATSTQPTTTQTQPAPQPPPRPAQPPAPQFKVPEIPQPPPNLTLADRLKFIEEHKEKQAKAIQAFHKQQQAAAAQAAQPQAAAAAAAGVAAAPQDAALKGAPAQQQQQQQQQRAAAAAAPSAAAQPQPPKAAAAAAQQQQQKGAAPAPQQQQQQALPQREEQRPSRAQAQAQRAARQQQQQQQGGGAQQQQQQGDSAGGGAHARPTANGHAAAPAQDKADVQGVYVRGLPQGEELTEALLEEHFSKFGSLKSLPGVPAVVIHVSPKFGKTAYIKFEQASSVQAARQSPPTIGSNTCEVLPMLTQYMNGPQPGMKGVSASRGGFRGVPRRGGRGGGRGSGSGPEDRERTADQGSSAPHRDFGAERPPRPAGAPDRRPPTMGGRGGGRGNRSRSGSASRPKRDTQGGPQGQPGPTPTYVPVATSQ